MTDAMTIRQPPSRNRRIFGAVALLLACTALAACVLMPGKFASSLDLRRDGKFSFAYKGEIFFVSPSDLDDRKSAEATFEPSACSDEKGQDRKCHPAEIDRQMREWQVRQKQEKEAQAAQMAAMSGNANLSDPKAAEEFARKLARQHGWRSVKSMGNGRFDVDYAVSGTLTHDFTFPVMEDFPLANPFVQVVLRADGTVRINAPAFSSGGGGSPLKSLAQLGAMEESGKTRGRTPQLPRMDGTFTLTTDGEPRTNNTEDGPLAIPGGARLTWKIDDRTASAPAALIAIVR